MKELESIALTNSLVLLARVINVRLFVTLAVLIPWVAIRRQLFDQISIQVAFFEFVGLVILSVIVTRPKITSVAATKLSAVVVLILLFYSVFNRPELSQWPQYWSGFGQGVALVGGAVTVAAFALFYLMQGKLRLANVVRSPLCKVSNLLGVAVTAWTFPSIVQPMDGFLNLGDGTEKVLDEIAAWVTGSVPGVHLGWGHNTLLGAPLWPLSLIDGYGESKIVAIALWVNFLVIVMVLVIAALMRRLIPQLPFWFSISVALISVTISGSPINTSLFQELNYLARLLMPLLLGYALIGQSNWTDPVKSFQIWGVSLLSALVFWNNIEFGAPAALSCVFVLLFASSNKADAWRRFAVFAGVHTAVVLFGIAIGIAQGGNWLERRLGVAGGFRSPGSMGVHNNTGPIPAFGMITVTLALAVVSIAIVVTSRRDPNLRTVNEASIKLSLYLGLWTIFSSTYLFYGVGGGAFRSQMYLVIFFLLTLSVGSMVFAHVGWVTGGTQKTFVNFQKRDFLDFAPVVFLLSVMLSSVLQSPNGLSEWRRIQTPQVLNRHLDEWSPERFDWITPSAVLAIADSFGGVDEVGWWFSYGHAIEIMTGIENLLGTTSFEHAFRSGTDKQSCRPVLRTYKTLVITHVSAVSYFTVCDLNFEVLSQANDEGFVVLEVQRLNAGE